MTTLRQRMIELLAERSMDLKGLSSALGIEEREAAAHLPHAAKSMGAKGGRLKVLWATCRNCGFEFKERRKLTPPSRCPQCKQSRIDGPFYTIIGVKK
jgi:hypothetical protein